MICDGCKNNNHEECSKCDCQHKSWSTPEAHYSDAVLQWLSSRNSNTNFNAIDSIDDTNDNTGSWKTN